MNIMSTQRFIEHLKKQFPDKLPSSREVTLGDVRERMGEQRVIRYLENLIENKDPTEDLLNVLQI